MPARVEHPGVVGPADRRTKLIRLVQVADHLLEADLGGEIELGGAKRLAFEAVRRQPLEHIQRGHGGAVGKVEDRVGRGEQDLFRAAATMRADRVGPRKDVPKGDGSWSSARKDARSSPRMRGRRVITERQPAS